VLSSVTYFNIRQNPITSLDVSTMSALTNFYAQDCAMSESVVNTVLISLDTSGATNGEVYINGTNAAPSWGTEESPSDTALAIVSLLEKDWTLTVTGDVPQWVEGMVTA